MNRKTIEEQIVAFLHEVAADDDQSGDVQSLTAQSPLVGADAVISSRALVELLLLTEELAEDELGAEFDWQSDRALSARRSLFKNAASLADHLAGLPRND